LERAISKLYRSKGESMTNNKDKILTVKQVAEYLGVKIDTVYLYIKNKKLKAFKLARTSSHSHWRIKESDLQEFINPIEKRKEN